MPSRTSPRCHLLLRPPRRCCHQALSSTASHQSLGQCHGRSHACRNVAQTWQARPSSVDSLESAELTVPLFVRKVFLKVKASEKRHAIHTSTATYNKTHGHSMTASRHYPRYLSTSTCLLGQGDLGALSGPSNIIRPSCTMDKREPHAGISLDATRGLVLSFIFAFLNRGFLHMFSTAIVTGFQKKGAGKGSACVRRGISEPGVQGHDFVGQLVR